MSYTAAIAHHAGGVGKTTTTLNLGYALAAQGHRVLLVDLDPQADLSDRLGLQPAEPTLVETLINGEGTPAPVRCSWDANVRLDVVPTTLDQAAFDLRLAGVQIGTGTATRPGAGRNPGGLRLYFGGLPPEPVPHHDQRPIRRQWGYRADPSAR